MILFFWIRADSSEDCVCVICAGIHTVVFDEQCQHILAMCSLEGEIIPLKQSILISSLVEVTLMFAWFSNLLVV